LVSCGKHCESTWPLAPRLLASNGDEPFTCAPALGRAGDGSLLTDWLTVSVRRPGLADGSVLRPVAGLADGLCCGRRPVAGLADGLFRGCRQSRTRGLGARQESLGAAGDVQKRGLFAGSSRSVHEDGAAVPSTGANTIYFRAFGDFVNRGSSVFGRSGSNPCMASFGDE
jgi:hypothetical protein